VLDFRYHALSLVAVFLALGIGIVLGATLGDTVVSQANKDVSSSLARDVNNALGKARSANARVAQRDRFDSAAFGYIADTKLRGRRVAIVSSGPLPQDIENSVRNAVKDAGGTIDAVSRFDARPDLVTLAAKLGKRPQPPVTTPSQTGVLGRRIGLGLVNGGGLARQLETAFPDSFKGDYRGADAVVYYRTADDRDNQSQAFEAALTEGLRASGAPVVGVEQTSTDPSQIPNYRNAGLSTVDDVDIPPGRIALVLTLIGRKGDYGFKETAQAPLPPAPGG
jgi:hypothetical protein